MKATTIVVTRHSARPAGGVHRAVAMPIIDDIGYTRNGPLHRKRSLATRPIATAYSIKAGTLGKCDFGSHPEGVPCPIGLAVGLSPAKLTACGSAAYPSKPPNTPWRFMGASPRKNGEWLFAVLLNVELHKRFNRIEGCRVDRRRGRKVVVNDARSRLGAKVQRRLRSRLWEERMYTWCPTRALWLCMIESPASGEIDAIY